MANEGLPSETGRSLSAGVAHRSAVRCGSTHPTASYIHMVLIDGVCCLGMENVAEMSARVGSIS